MLYKYYDKSFSKVSLFFLPPNYIIYATIACLVHDFTCPL